MGARAALIVGTSVYEDTTLARLRTPEADVRALAGVLSHPDVGAFDDVVSLIDEPESSVRRAIFRFFQGRSRDDLLLLYFSGHGVKDDHGRLFLAMRDTACAQLKATALPTSYITECMDECRSKRQILVLDCCNSGAFARGTKGDRAALDRATFEGNGYGRVVLTASDSTQYALEGDRVVQEAELSLFTHFLLEGLTTGAAARAGESVITLDDWYDYAYEQVVNRTPTQTPRKWVYNQEGGLAIARTAPRALPAAALPAELSASLEDARTWVREGAVGELARIAASGDAALRAAAAAALARMAADDDSLRVRRAAESALGQSAGPAAAPAPARRDSDAAVPAAVIGEQTPSHATALEQHTAAEQRTETVAVQPAPGPPLEEATAQPARTRATGLWWSAMLGVLAGTTVVGMTGFSELTSVGSWFLYVLPYAAMFLGVDLPARLAGDRLRVRAFGAVAGWCAGVATARVLAFLLIRLGLW